MVEETLNRKALIDKTLKEDERSDLKQHADKMLRDFEKFNKSSSNRAIWELVQNACDLSTRCEIVIDYRNDQIAFTHNGKPFTTRSLISLIKQVSGKYGDQDDIPEVGKYGTGFLTTHSFGRRFLINSVLDTGEFIFPIKDFSIDRRPRTWELLSDNIAAQKKNVFDIIKNENPIDVSEFTTTFTFQPETSTEREYVKTSSLDLSEYIPLVFTVNDRLQKITVIDNNGKADVFSRVEKVIVENDKGVPLNRTIVLKNSEEKWMYSLVDKENALEIILPINKKHEVYEFSERTARLFLFYPLVGSETFGINFLINCDKFLPNEPRSGIHLKSNKDQVKDQEEQNRLIIQKCTEIIFNFLESNIIKVANPLLYANVKFNVNSEDNLLNEYFQSLQLDWNKKLNLLPYVKTIKGFIPINQSVFLSEELLIENHDDLKVVYTYVSRYYDNIPVLDDVIRWSKYALNWNDDSISFVRHDDILNYISKESLFEFVICDLIAYYKYLFRIGRSSVFNDLALLPNINGTFHKLGHLLEAKNLDDQLISIGQVLIPDSLSKLIHDDFKFNLDLSCFNRKDYSNDLKLKLDDQEAAQSIFFSEKFEEVNYHKDLLNNANKLREDYFIALLNFCKLTNNISSVSKPNKLLRIISRYYGESDNLFHIPSLQNESEDLDKRGIRKILIQIFFNLISLHNQPWVEDNIEFLAEICSLEEDSYKEVYKNSSIYPNQIFELRKSTDVKRDLGVWKDIKEIFRQVKREDIDEVLSVKSFNDFIPDEQFVTNRYLTIQIEDLFFENTVAEIESHPFKDIIISIIPKLTKKLYQDLFPQLDSKKANIMISVVTNEERKDDIFAIVTLKDDKLKKLGELVKKDNFLELLEKAGQLIEEEIYKQFDFAHKYAIGTYIEEKIREQLNEQLKYELLIENISTDNIQGGQDIIIHYNNEVVHYIEVKSRWDNRNSITMSKLQLERAATNSEMYSLCSVDVSNFYGEGDKYKLDITQIIPLTKFVNHIGGNIKPLVENNLLAEKELDEKVRLIEYRGIVPQSIVKDGTDFNTFISYLVNKIQTSL